MRYQNYARYLLALSAFLLTLNNPVRASVLSCQPISQLTDEQLQVIYESYRRGLQEDLGYTLAAIAWRESSLGKYRINPRSGDFGSYGINYKTVMRLDRVDYYAAIDLLEQLVYDDDLCAGYALATLRWNLQHFDGDWRKAVAMYNAGNKWKNGMEYAADIAFKVRLLKLCSPMTEVKV